jgi:hypothetical protein
VARGDPADRPNEEDMVEKVTLRSQGSPKRWRPSTTISLVCKCLTTNFAAAISWWYSLLKGRKRLMVFERGSVAQRSRNAP